MFWISAYFLTLTFNLCIIIFKTVIIYYFLLIVILTICSVIVIHILQFCSFLLYIFIFLGFHVFFFYLGFLSRPFMNHRTAGERGGHFFNSTSTHSIDQPEDYCRELTSAHRLQPDSNWTPLVSECRSLTSSENMATMLVLYCLCQCGVFMELFLYEILL